MSSTATARFWAAPELKVHVGNTLDTKRDLLHLAQADRATCALLLPLLYERVCVAVDHLALIAGAFRKYPEYAAQCRALRVESPDRIERGYLQGNMWRDKRDDEFAPDPSKRYDAASFMPDWDDDQGHSVSPSEESDPADWIMADDGMEGDEGEEGEEGEDAIGDEGGEGGAGGGLNGIGLAGLGQMDESNVAWHGPNAGLAMYAALQAAMVQNPGGEEEEEDDEDDEAAAAADARIEAEFQEIDNLLEMLEYDEDHEPTEESLQALFKKHENNTSPAWLKAKDSLEKRLKHSRMMKVRTTEGRARYKKACDDLLFVLTKLSEFGRLASFEWVWESSRMGAWPVSGVDGDLWAALEKNAPSLQKLVLKFFRPDKQTWMSLPSTNYQALRVLHLNMANAHHWEARPLHDMLKHLPELEALELKLTWCCTVQQLTLAGTYPKLRYFSWLSGMLKDRQEADEPDPTAFFQRHPDIDTLDINCDLHSAFDFEDDAVLPRLQAVSYGSVFRPDLSPLGALVARRPVVAVRARLPHAGLRAFLRLPASASATVKWLTVAYYTNFRLDLATYAEALHAAPLLKELTIRTCSSMYNGRLTPLDLPDVLNALPHDHGLTALTLYDPDGDALAPQDLEDLPVVPPALKYIGWETNAGRVLYTLEKRGDKTVAVEVLYPRKKSWVWTQNSILDHSDGELWADPFDGDVIPGLSRH